MNDYPPLLPGNFYHIYNRGNNHEDIFVEKDNYRYFMQQYHNYVNGVADTYAYCLLKNHFHLLVRVKDNIIRPSSKPFRFGSAYGTAKDLKGFGTDDLDKGLKSSESLIEPEEIPEFVSQKFSNFFNSYSKSFNKKYNRTGSLFQKPFRRKPVDSSNYLSQVMAYIHLNPEKHGFASDFREYPYSSYHEILNNDSPKLRQQAVFEVRK